METRGQPGCYPGVAHSFLKRFYLFLIMCTCLYVSVSVGTHGGQKRVLDTPAGVMSNFHSVSVGPGNRILFLCKAVYTPNH